ncbi:TldD/PmbA family protein [Falsibacillus pallidus]|uniref:PmbA protein n=1 Tax=Falsibacillus pallidus TaxID=493781 RepID=A0A370GR70_9BACI|nr:TldD/PmbA family protein [Falsibacillus pallidus]RDI45820.1 PmbA protein [Falsibacillus pallidus]
MNLQEFQKKLLNKGEAHGFSDMEIYYEKAENFASNIYKGEIDSYSTSVEMGLSFRGLYNGNMGYAYTEKLDEESIDFLLNSAMENAAIMEVDTPEEIFSGSTFYEQGNFYSASLKETSVDEKLAFLKELDRCIYEADPRVDGTDYFTMQVQEKERALFNNKGLSLHEKLNDLILYVSVVVKENGITKTGEKLVFSKDLRELDPAKIAKEAVEEAVSYLEAVSIPNKQYPIVLRNTAAASLFGTFASIFSAEEAQKGMSQLKDKVGDSIASSILDVVDDPFLKTGVFSRTFDGEGVASKPLNLIEKGKLTSLLHNRKTAKKEGTESTGHAYKDSYKGALTVAPSNLYITPSQSSFDDLVSSIEEGVVITGLSGLHSGANAVSGDFSVAAYGYRIVDGKIKSAVNQMTIAGNFFDLLKDIEEVGSDLDFAFSVSPGYIGSPSLKVKKLSVTVE